MIERDFIVQKTREFYIKKFIEKKLGNVGISGIKLKKIPLGEKIIIETSRPSLIVGSKGSNIKSLTRTLKKDFNLENPQIEINEIKNIFLDANIVAERIVSSLERFGSARFKGVGHKMLESVIHAGALGIEIIISGKIPGARAKSWRFYLGYLKKCGDVAVSGVRKANKTALLKSGIIGVKVSIMPPDLVLPDNITLLSEPVQIIEEIKENIKEAESDKKKTSVKKKKSTRKKAPAKKKESKVNDEEIKTKVIEKKPVKEEVKEEPKIEESVSEEENKTETKIETVVEEKPVEEEAKESKTTEKTEVNEQ
ncbi:MAG: 30S ribosomal protein S3 [Nanoarchaeota archaeon]|nr:30S ribosomal protein S3 [Nanoarchaeota archaeon]MBU1632771.1 30S ribosomal protein S3 [Nanoarchaeota archaeon]MBU1876389.1 30S ribosomal protein S3 [Nanoarchaeota archaeon]